MDYIVDLEVFHGPLDLLLYLIDKNEVDIYDIPIAAITDQYMQYLQETGDYDLDILGDFLIMASYLLNLKSKLLLPGLKGQTAENDEEEITDPREELVQKLLDYKKIKKAAEMLASRQDGEFKRIFFRDAVYRTEEKEEIWVSIGALTRAYKAIFNNNKPHETFNMPSGDINVMEKMEELLNRLENFRQGVIFQDLFTGVLGKREALVLFLALLELIRQKKVTAIQETGFADIKVFLRVAEENVNA